VNATSVRTIDRVEDSPEAEDLGSVLELQGLDDTLGKLLNGSCISLQSVVEER
jgi:hypothetical protein